MSIGTWPLKVMEILVPLFLIASVALPREIPHDVGIVAAGLLLAVVGALLSARGTAWMVRAGLYVGSTCMMYYGEIAPRMPLTHLSISLNVWFALLAGLVVLAIRYTGEDRFQTTPLDYLIVLLAAAMPFLPDVTVGEVSVSVLTAKLIVLFFAFELLLHVRSSTVSRLGWVTAWMLGGLVVRAWWL
jgi:UDP-GlcNAc:undecaprenyl-phosphate GlcNAc-1-phosphate transferase